MRSTAGRSLSACQTVAGARPEIFSIAAIMSRSRFEPGKMMTADFMGARARSRLNDDRIDDSQGDGEIGIVSLQRSRGPQRSAGCRAEARSSETAARRPKSQPWRARWSAGTPRRRAAHASRIGDPALGSRESLAKSVKSIGCRRPAGPVPAGAARRWSRRALHASPASSPHRPARAKPRDADNPVRYR